MTPTKLLIGQILAVFTIVLRARLDSGTIGDCNTRIFYKASRWSERAVTEWIDCTLKAVHTRIQLSVVAAGPPPAWPGARRHSP
jgi:hypothetical protein